MAQRGFGGLTHWGLKARNDYFSTSHRLVTSVQMQLGESRGVQMGGVCAGGVLDED